MEKLVDNINGELVTYSRKIAAKFNKEHKDVLRAIKNLECSDEFNERNFAPVHYTDAKGQLRNEWQITEKGFTFLAMGFTGKDAAKFKEDYIEQFSEMRRMIMDRQVKPQSEDEIILRGMMVLQTRIEKQNATIELQEHVIKVQAPKVEYVDKVLDADGLITITTIAKEINMSAIELNRVLHDLKVIYKQHHDNTWVLYAQHQGNGYTGTRTTIFMDSTGNNKTRIDTLWTQKGRLFIHQLLNKKLQA